MSEIETKSVPVDSADRVQAFLRAHGKRKYQESLGNELVKRARPSAPEKSVEKVRKTSSETRLQELISQIDRTIAEKARSRSFWTSSAQWVLDDYLRNLVLILETKTIMADAKQYRDYLLDVCTYCKRALQSRLLPWVRAKSELSNAMIEKVVQPFAIALGVGISFALQDFDSLADDNKQEYSEYLFRDLLATGLDSVSAEGALLPPRLYDPTDKQQPSRPSCEFLNKSACKAPCRYDSQLQQCLSAQRDPPKCASVSLEAAQNIADMRQRLITVFSGLLDFSDRMLRDLRLRAAAQTSARIPEQISNMLSRTVSLSWLKAAMIGVAAFGYEAARFVPLELLFDRGTAQTIRGAAFVGGTLGAAYATSIGAAAAAKHAGLLQARVEEPACTLPFVRPTALALTEAQRLELLRRAQKKRVEPQLRSRVRRRMRATKDDESEASIAASQELIAQAAKDVMSQ